MITHPTEVSYRTDTDRLRREAGLLTADEKLRFAAELVADAAQVEPRPARKSALHIAVQMVRTAIMTR